MAMREHARQLERELAEQCRLNGMGAEREAKLVAQLDEAWKQRDRLAELLRQYRDRVPLGYQPHMLAYEADEALAAVKTQP